MMGNSLFWMSGRQRLISWEDHGARAPDGGGCADVLEGATGSRQREPYEVVEVQEARVVVPPLQPERAGDPRQEQCLRRSMRTNQ